MKMIGLILVLSLVIHYFYMCYMDVTRLTMTVSKLPIGVTLLLPWYALQFINTNTDASLKIRLTVWVLAQPIVMRILANVLLMSKAKESGIIGIKFEKDKKAFAYSEIKKASKTKVDGLDFKTMFA